MEQGESIDRGGASFIEAKVIRRLANPVEI